jgi:hypothetical protein
MTHVQTETATQSEVVFTVLMHLNNGKIKNATACFAENFQFNDRGIGLEFKNRERLAEFFQKIRELYPDSSLQTDTILVSGDAPRLRHKRKPCRQCHGIHNGSLG